MRYLRGLSALLVLAALFLACPPPGVEPPPPINGNYTGTYEYVFSDSIIEQHILFSFTNDSFWMSLDKSFHPYSQDRVFCDVRGIYAVTQGLELVATKSQDSNFTDETCQVEKGPFGVWSLEQPTENVVLLKSHIHQDSVDIFRTLRLERQR